MTKTEKQEIAAKLIRDLETWASELMGSEELINILNADASKIYRKEKADGAVS